MTRNELAILVVLAAGATVAGCGRSAAPVKGAPAEGGKKVLYWVDPMHPAYKSDRPGKAPDCGMDLVPVYAQEAPKPADAPPAAQAAPRGRKVLYWYDPMQPGTHFDHPGKSPFMDMELVP